MFDVSVVTYLVWYYGCWCVFCDMTLQSGYLHFSTEIASPNTWRVWHVTVVRAPISCDGLLRLWKWMGIHSSVRTFVAIHSSAAWSTFCFIWHQLQEQTRTSAPALLKVAELQPFLRVLSISLLPSESYPSSCESRTCSAYVVVDNTNDEGLGSNRRSKASYLAGSPGGGLRRLTASQWPLSGQILLTILSGGGKCMHEHQ